MKSRSARSRSTTDANGSIESNLARAAELVRDDPPEALRHARRALDYARAAGDISAEADALHLTGRCHAALGELDEAVARLGEAIELGRALGSTERIAEVANSLGATCYRAADMGRALETLLEGTRLVGDESNPLWGRLRGNLALVYRDLGDYEKAVKIYLELIEHYEGRNEIFLAMSLDNLAPAYAALGDIEQCIACLHRSLEVARRCGYTYGEAMALGNLGAAHNEAGRPREALAYLHEALATCTEIGDEEGAARALHNIGISYSTLGDHPSALRYFRRALKQDPGGLKTGSTGYSLASIGRSLLETGRNREALASFRRALKIAVAISDSELEYRIHRELSTVHENLGDHESALTHQRRYSEIRERLSDEATRRAVAELQIRFDVERTAREREIYRLRSEQLELDLGHRSRELAALALRLVEKGELIDSIKETLQRELTAGNGSERSLLRTALEQVDRHTHGDDDWAAFESQFHRVHPEYIRTLSEQYPTLSRTELRVCALLKVGLATKEIARLLHVSVRDIENHRYRIRKKLAIEGGGDLVAFLAAL